MPPDRRIDGTVDRDGGGHGLIVDGQQLSHLKRRPVGDAHRGVDVHHVVKTQRPAVVDEELEDGEVDTIGTDLLVGKAGMPQQRDPGFLEIQAAVRTMVNGPLRPFRRSGSGCDE